MNDRSSSDRKHIVVINHSDEVLQLIRVLLEEEEGYRVTTQHMYENALQQLEEEQPDLIILDYMWELDNSGWSLLQKLRLSRKTRHIPVIVCTAAVARAKELTPHFESMGISVILKPFDIETLYQHVANHLRDRPSDDQQPTST